MTLHEVAKQLVHLTGGQVNGSTFTVDTLTKHLRDLFTMPWVEGNRILINLTLPDGNWYCMVSRWGSYRVGWDYDIPDTREQETRMLHSFK